MSPPIPPEKSRRVGPRSHPAAHRGGAPAARWRSSQGRRLLVLENGLFRVELWPEMGGAITSYIHQPSNIDVIWRNPWGQPPRRGTIGQPLSAGSDLFDVMDGSWYVSLPNGFFSGDYFGAPLGTHGEMRCVPWEVESVRSRGGVLRVVLRGESVRTPLTYRRELTVRSGSALLEWRETVGNRSRADLPVAWLQHPTFSGPLLDGARLIVPARTLRVTRTDRPSRMQLKAGYRGRWPHAPLRASGKMRDCSLAPLPGSGLDHSLLLTDFTAGQGCLWNERLQLGFAMQWDLARFPCAWSWSHASGGSPRYPMWAEGDLITLQPSTSPPAPFPDLLRRRALLTIPARGEISTPLLTGFVTTPPP